MRSTVTSTSTRIHIDTLTEVDEDGAVRVTTTVTSHGNAKNVTLGKLVGDRYGWLVVDSNGLGLTGAKTKGETIEAFTRLAIAQAARWAA
jgi:hypothetical protein